MRYHQSFFKNRQKAGRLLAQELKTYEKEDSIVLALPRGGVVLGREVANYLKVPLDVVIVRKIGSPNNPEYAIGAIAEDDIHILDNSTIVNERISPQILKELIAKESQELQRRIVMYRDSRPLPYLENKTAILVDDGLATGYTMQAAIEAVENQNPRKIVVAIPVGASHTVEKMRDMADDIVCLLEPHDLRSIGSYYNDFEQVNDREVVEYLQGSRHNQRDSFLYGV